MFPSIEAETHGSAALILMTLSDRMIALTPIQPIAGHLSLFWTFSASMSESPWRLKERR